MAHRRQTKPRNPDDDAAETMHRVAAQEMKPAPRAIGNSDDLGDVEALYDSDARRPKNGQTWRFDSSRPGKYHGLWVPSGGARIIDSRTGSLSGGEAGVAIKMVPDGWNPKIGITGSLEAHLTLTDPGGGYPDDDFYVLLQAVPWDIGAGPPPGDGTVLAGDPMPANENSRAGHYGASNLSVPADLRAGTPHAFLTIKQPTGAPDVGYRITWNVRPDGPL